MPARRQARRGATGLPRGPRRPRTTRRFAGCHPVVAAAVGVPFDPEDADIMAVARLGVRPGGSPPLPEARRRRLAGEVPPATAERPRPHLTEPSPGLSRLELGAGAVVLPTPSGCSTSARGPRRRRPEPPTNATPRAPDGDRVGPRSPLRAGRRPTDPARGRAARAVEAVGSPRLPATACQAGADAVTCRNPAPNIRTVVLTPYPDPGRALRRRTSPRSRGSRASPCEQNDGDCSNSALGGRGRLEPGQGSTRSTSPSTSRQAGGLDRRE